VETLRPLHGRWPAGKEPRLLPKPDVHLPAEVAPDADADPVLSALLRLTGQDIASDPRQLYVVRLLFGQDAESHIKRENLIRRVAADPSASEEMQFFAANVGVLRGPTEGLHDILVRLARSATKERARLFAALHLGDREVVEQLAAAATSAAVRRSASAALELERLRTLILQVGRLRRAIVCISGERVGLLEELRSGSRFRYDEAWLARRDARPISPTLPLRSEPYESEGLHPFFDNLLPEGWLLDLKGQRLKLDARDAFGLLLASGEDLIGAVDVLPEPA
jgi:serine/threonine-protein kinase HipA